MRRESLTTLHKPHTDALLPAASMHHTGQLADLKHAAALLNASQPCQPWPADFPLLVVVQGKIHIFIQLSVISGMQLTTRSVGI